MIVPTVRVTLPFDPEPLRFTVTSRPAEGKSAALVSTCSGSGGGTSALRTTRRTPWKVSVAGIRLLLLDINTDESGRCVLLLTWKDWWNAYDSRCFFSRLLLTMYVVRADRTIKSYVRRITSRYTDFLNRIDFVDSKIMWTSIPPSLYVIAFYLNRF